MPPWSTRVIDYIHRTGEFTLQCDWYIFSYLAQRGARREGARCRTQRAAQIQHLIQRQRTILHRISRPETRHEIQREAQRIVRISGMPAFLMMTCRRGTREADPRPGRVPPKLGGALCAAAPRRHATQLPYLRTDRLTPHAPDRWWTFRVGPRNRLIPNATYRRRPTANPSNAPPTTNTMITIRMNLPIPATKPRASSSAASRPTWVAAKVMAIHGRALRRHDVQNLGVSVRMHVPNSAPTTSEIKIGPMVISCCQDGGGHARPSRSAPLPSRQSPASSRP